jgi:hypothetical protein
MPEAEQTRVFERFVRLDHAPAQDSRGAGLGLAIVAVVATAHGGTVHIEGQWRRPMETMRALGMGVRWMPASWWCSQRLIRAIPPRNFLTFSPSRQQQEFAGGAASLQILVGAGGVGEWVPAADGDP